MKRAIVALGAVIILQSSVAASATGSRGAWCSTGRLAGNWAFATDVGRDSGAAAGITAIGIFTVDRQGNVEGVFDATVEAIIFLGDVTFEGEMSVDRNCRGTLSFVTSTGASRTDSFLMLNRYELWGMSQDPANLWTFRARRLPGH